MFEHYIYTGTKRLRCGYSTGCCAALAARAATEMLLQQRIVSRASMVVPAGILVEADVLEASWSPTEGACAIKKDAGDDIDVTHGELIFAHVVRQEIGGIRIVGGSGVGVVTKPGLDQPVGEAAINSVPRAMIETAVRDACNAAGYAQGLVVTISVPNGEKLAAKTFNPQLGIEGGISILGTTGIVKPRSLSALKASIEVEIRQHAALGEQNLVVTLGNYGATFLETMPHLAQQPTVSCANFVGFALDCAARYHFKRVLLVGHFGKLVKVAGGVMDTHSHTADCRCEVVCAHAAAAGASQVVAQALLEAPTTDACLDILEQEACFPKVLARLSIAVQGHLERRVEGAYDVGSIVFTNKRGELFRTAPVDEIQSMLQN